MLGLKWDETDFLECLEVAPEIEEDETSHTYVVNKSNIRLTLQLWQREKMLELTLTNISDGNIITSYAILVRDGAIYKKENNAEFLLFKNSIVLPSRFSYLDLGGVTNIESSNIGYNIKLFVTPSIKIEYLRENT